MKHNKTYRIRTGVNDGTASVSFSIDNSVETYELLSLNISQKNAYRLMSSERGVVAGRVLANGGFGIPNARVSIFVQYEDTENLKQQILYHYSSPKSLDDNNIRYNLLPDFVDDECHQNVGTFPSKRIMLDDDNWVEVFDKYYKYTTRTNNAGDYMIYGVPVGMQQLHMDLDLSDIGPLSQRPRDMMTEGLDANRFESPNKFKTSENLGSLVQIQSEDVSLYVYPFWGDTTSTETNACITRHDINVNYKFKPTCVFMGSVMSDTGENSMSPKCVGSKNQGKMSEMMTGEGKIEMIRKTFDGNTEEFSIKGNQLINANGVWCYQIPMNLDYVKTDEFGNTVLSDNPETGIPTRARVRFRISMTESPSDATARKRARYLVPNNPHLIESDYPDFTKSKSVDYEFGTETKEENFRDLMWNNVYTVKSYIPRIQKSNLPNNLRHIGIKMVNHPGSNNPMPFNNLRIKMNFVYMFMCALVKALVYLVYGVNKLITAISYGLFKIAQAFIGLTYGFSGKLLKFLGSFLCNSGNCGRSKWKTGKEYGNDEGNLYYKYLKRDRDNQNEENDNDDFDPSEDSGNDDLNGIPVPYRACVFMLTIIKKILDQKSNYPDPAYREFSDFKFIMKMISRGGNNASAIWNNRGVGVRGVAAFLLAIVYLIGCGIELSGLCENEEGEEISTVPGTVENITDIFKNMKNWFGEEVSCDNDVAKLFNCIENDLAQENEVTSFNFYNDWVNGVLYFPLWYRRIKKRVKINGTEITTKDKWCSADSNWIRMHSDRRQIKVYDTCKITREIDNTATQMGESLKPLDDDYTTVDVDASFADDETGTEVVVFKRNNGYVEKNCYGYKCHRYSRTAIPMRSGLMKEKETMIGDLVYYYKPCEYNTKYTKDLITLFATDIVLLGSLSDCDIHGIPQFFKALESTTYNMPPDLMSETYEYRENGDVVYNENNNSGFIDESTRRTEYTGSDWGDLGVDQSNYKSVDGKYEANENIYDNGGLFYGITCFNSYTKPKSCINLARICEFGVSLDESQDILSVSAVRNAVREGTQIDDNAYETLTPDGFVSYDEIYSPDYRSMFATLNSNFLRTKLNYATGLYEYDLDHLYVDNFDGSMSVLMKAQSVNGNTKISGFLMPSNYTGNHNLEKSSDAYLNFRYGNYSKANGKRLYFYDYEKKIAQVPVGIPGITPTKIMASKRLPRYENSFYFYFGISEGKTAIDEFYSLYYADCRNDEVLPQNYTITPYPNSVCPENSSDGCVSFSFNANPEFSVSIVNADNDSEGYHTEKVNAQQFYIGTKRDGVDLPGYVHVKLYYDNLNDEETYLPNGIYHVTVTTGDDEVLNHTLYMVPPSISHNVEANDFTVKNSELDTLFISTTAQDEYDWSVMFPDIANYVNNVWVESSTSANRGIGGYIVVGGIDVPNYSIKVEPAAVSFFMDGNGQMLYTAPEVIVVNGDTVYSSSGDGYLGKHGTDFYFGVPYGEQRYIVTITQMCYEETLRESVPEYTSNYATESVFVHEGNFKMYINGIDYDNIQAFKTGWTETWMKSTNPPPSFDHNDIYGWNDLDNIGFVYDEDTDSVVPLAELSLSWSDNPDKIVAAGNAVAEDYDGNGAQYYIEGNDCSTPYTWTSDYCLLSEIWDSDRATVTADNWIKYTDPDTYEVSVVDRLVKVLNQDNTDEVLYKDNTETVCIESISSGDITYSNGYSDLNGPTVADINAVIDRINDIIFRRLEFVKSMKGSFRIGRNYTTLALTYRTVSTPVKYLIAGSREDAARRAPGEYEDHTVIIGTRVVFDTSLEHNSIDFVLPTITYNAAVHHYNPYSEIGTVNGESVTREKIPYYVSIQNNSGMAIPSASSNIGTAATTKFVDNFSLSNRSNPNLSKMFGVHFFNNPMYYRQRRVVCVFNNMIKYGTADMVMCNALVVGYAVNGMPEIQVKLDGVSGLVHTSSLMTGGDDFKKVSNDRIIYGDSVEYGVYQQSIGYKDENDQPIEYQYFTTDRNRLLTVDDGYGTPYDTTLMCDYEMDTSSIVIYSVANTDTSQPKVNIPLNYNRNLPNDTRYHVFWHTGTNHPLDWAVQDQTVGNGWKFQNEQGEDKLANMFKPNHNFTADAGYLDTKSEPAYQQYELDLDQQKNHLFFIAESPSTGTLVFSPVIECARVNVVRNFNVESNPGQDAYTLYFIRKWQGDDDDRTNCNITDFHYLTDFPFTISFKTSDDNGATFQTMASYVIDPNDCWQGRIQLDDEMYTNSPDYTQTFGEAIKVSLSDYSQDFGNTIPSWWSVWVTDAIGVERACPGVSGEHTFVTEL